jgi:hypothetical protein
MSFQLGQHYTREEIHDVLGDRASRFGQKIERTAELFAKQRDAVPTFIKRGAKQWHYVGEFRVKRLSKDPVESRLISDFLANDCWLTVCNSA